MTHSTPVARKLGDKTFTDQDQRDFARASRDWNPMHVDPVAARRLLSGRQVVHGIHTLIHALNLWSRPEPVERVRVTCSFANPVNVGDLVDFSQVDEDDDRTRIIAAVNDLACTEVVIEPLAAADTAFPARLASGPDRPRRRIGELAVPLDEAPGSQVGALIELDAWDDSLAITFSQAAALLGRDGLSAVSRLSFFVGMVCPGRHSVFSSLEFTTSPMAGGDLRFEVRKYDPRFRLFTVAFEGALRGELRAFLRLPPQLQPSARETAERLAGHEFKGTRSLVVGGSRGLGETTAKIIAAGGGDVIVSYATGVDDARAVAADINANARGHCDIAQLDLRSAFQGAPGIDPSSLDAAYFFATPRIYAKRSELFDRNAFDEFAGFYLQRFYELCRWLEQVDRPKPLRVYLPSTVFITERPKGMTEYAMAKAAAEVLADDLNRSLRNVTVVYTRLPRLATDQTASILKVSVASNLDAMLAVVHVMAG
jgi:acyl dehydratase/NAD(P)-dependent dehydrogenase (short-subunit alcohol dehydrogenase family)